MLDVPDLEDPVGVERVNSAASLVTHQVDDVVVLEWRPGAEIHALEGLGRRDIMLGELILPVQEDELTQRVDCLQRFRLDACAGDLELL